MFNRMFAAGAAVLTLVSGGVWVVQAATAQENGNPAPAPAQNTAPAPNPTPNNAQFALGFVDLSRIGREFEGTKSGQSELDTFQQSLRRQLDDREAVRFLDENERGEVDKLRAVAAPSEEQKKRLNDFYATSKSREAQLRALQQNPNKNDNEKAEADRLTRLSTRTDEDLDALGEKLEMQLQAKGDEISKRLTDTVSTSIEVVAKEKGYSAVVDKKAMLFGGVDVTDEVLKQLNKK